MNIPPFVDNFFSPLRIDIRLKELVLFYHQLGALIKAGLPLYQAVAHLEEQESFKRLRMFLHDSRLRIQAGRSFSEALAMYPQIFSEVQIELVRAGEAGGALEETLEHVAEYLEWELKLRRYLSRQTLYAKTVFVSIVLLMPFLLGLMLGGDLWHLVIAALQTLFPLLLLGLLVLCLLLLFRTLLSRWPAAGDLYDLLKWRLPGIEVVTRNLALAKFGRTLAMLYRAGVPVSSAIRAALQTSGSRVLSRLIPQITADVENGMPLAVTFRRCSEFPSIFVEHLETGAHTGDLDAMLNKAAAYLEGEAETRAFQAAYIFSEVFFLLVAFYLLQESSQGRQPE